MHKTFNVFLAFFKAIFFFMLGCIMPNKGKRILFLTAVYRYLVDRDALSKDKVHQLNSIMSLADNDSALLLPPSIYRRVISEEHIAEAIKGIETLDKDRMCLTYNEARKVSQSIVSKSPEWLNYGDKKTMEQDLVSLFYCRTA